MLSIYRILGSIYTLLVKRLDYITYFKVEDGEMLPCVLQDPVYSTAEANFLRNYGFSVVDDPEAFSQIGPGTLVLSIGTYQDIMKRISTGKWPAAIICETSQSYKTAPWDSGTPIICSGS